MFAEKDRQIFGPYFNGVADVYGDPLCLYRRLVHHLGGEPGKYLRGMKDPDEATRFTCTEQVIAAARAVFELAPFDPNTSDGTLDRDALNVVRQFTEWLDTVKKNSPTPPTSPEPTGEPDCCPVPSPTSAGSDSGSTGTASGGARRGRGRKPRN